MNMMHKSGAGDGEEVAEDVHNGLCVASRRDAGMTEARVGRLCSTGAHSSDCRGRAGGVAARKTYDVGTGISACG